MPSYIHIAHNLYISNNPAFGQYDQETVFHLLCSVDVNFSSALGVLPFSSCKCLIDYQEEHPACSRLDSYNHLILLHTKEDYWSKWLYQFAHEYCHHLISGEMTGRLQGLFWFEEVLCELSSMWHIHLAHLQWSNAPRDMLRRFAPNHRDYLDALLSKHPQLYAATARRGFLQCWEQILSEPIYHRDYYNALAARMLPMFVTHPELWKIILHFGDMRRWRSLPELFSHLRAKADSNYEVALFELQHLLFL